MKLRRLILNNFGPYSYYDVEFPSDNRAFVLITGKNNAGKTSLIRALRLIDGALKLSRHSGICTDMPLKGAYIRDLYLRRLIHGFDNGEAEITAVLDTGREIKVHIASDKELITGNLPPRTPKSYQSLFGFIPPLGQIREEERPLDKQYILQYIDTNLAPLHFRNHIRQLFNDSQFDLLKKIIYETWNNVILGKIGYDINNNLLSCPYTEEGITGEISFAGQGFQIWLQIMTHLIRLSDCSTVILDEPEIFLHPEKQHKMIHTFREYFTGSMIIATHSSELMNEVDFSHIIHIQHGAEHSKFISTQNRKSLEDIRQEVGSSFNLIASQFEDVDRLIFTENTQDYDILREIANAYKSVVRTHNVPISGLSKWTNAISFKNAYKMLFGRDTRFSIMLDKDFYPKEYLNDIIKELSRNGIRDVPPFYRPTAVRVFPLISTYSLGVRPPSELCGLPSL